MTEWAPSNPTRPGYVTNLDALSRLSHKDRIRLKEVCEKHPFLANEYYLSLIDWEDPNDPIRKIIIPSIEELENWGQLDASNENAYRVLPGVQHKYRSTVLFQISSACAGICRYCFRKRIFIQEEEEALHDLPRALDYVREHTEITNCLLTGGDPLMLPAARLDRVLRGLKEIDHLKVVRVGTRMLSFNPYRVLDDPDLLSSLEAYNSENNRLYVMTHFSHPRELTPLARLAVDLIRRTGSPVLNQCPMVKGVNDDPHTLASLFRELVFIGASPYYVFQCRPALGNRTYAVPIERGYDVFETAKGMVSGLAKRARYVMSHATGKIEIVGRDDNSVFFKYHRAALDQDTGRFMVCDSNPDAYWFDDYRHMRLSRRLNS